MKEIRPLPDIALMQARANEALSFGQSMASPKYLTAAEVQARWRELDASPEFRELQVKQNLWLKAAMQKYTELVERALLDQILVQLCSERGRMDVRGELHMPPIPPGWPYDRRL